MLMRRIVANGFGYTTSRVFKRLARKAVLFLVDLLGDAKLGAVGIEHSRENLCTGDAVCWSGTFDYTLGVKGSSTDKRSLLNYGVSKFQLSSCNVINYVRPQTVHF